MDDSSRQICNVKGGTQLTSGDDKVFLDEDVSLLSVTALAAFTTAASKQQPPHHKSFRAYVGSQQQATESASHLQEHLEPQGVEENQARDEVLPTPGGESVKGEMNRKPTGFDTMQLRESSMPEIEI